MKRQRWYAVVLCLALLGGCGLKEEEKPIQSTQVQDSGYVGMTGDHPELNYEITPMRPGVLTDQTGYDSDSTKVVLFLGSSLGDSFQVIDAESGSTVYSGEIEYSGIDPQSGERVSYGVFTGLVENGDYYIKTSVIGESYPFSISDSLYTDVFRSACIQFQSLWETEAGYRPQELRKDAETICNLLIAFEYYTGIFQDDLGIDGSGNDIPDLLDIIRNRVNVILTVDSRELSYEQLACYTGILAQFAQDYKSFDAVYADACLTKAQEAFRILEQSKEPSQDESYYFYALSQLYRATGYVNYHTQLKNILKQGAVSGEMAFYGNVAYMSCKYKVDADLCSGIMTALMNEAEEISQISSKDPYLVCGYDLQEICESMSKLALVNYVITNHEYVTVQENHLHYLLGRNPAGLSYISGIGYQSAETEECISADSYQSSALIFMMSEIIREEMSD